MEEQSVLVVRSGSLPNLLVVLESLGKRFPRSEITVFTDPDILDELSEHPCVADIAVYSNLKVFLARQLWELRRQEYGCKVALFTNEDEGRYNKFKVLAFLCRAPRMIIYNENGDSFEWDYRHRWIIWGHMKWRLLAKFFSGVSLHQNFFFLLLRKVADLFLLPFAFIHLLCSVGWLFAKRGYGTLFFERREQKKILKRMEVEWDERAIRNARYYVHSTRMDQTDEEFDQSGAEDVKEFIEAELEFICGGRNSASNMRMLEIGCGIGRMTRHLGRIFKEVHGIDVSGHMIGLGKARLKGIPNVFLYKNNGKDLSNFSDNFFDFCFSFIVFQHIPDKDVIVNYIKEVHRVLKPDRIFKFQVHGVVSEDYLKRPKDTWHGVSFSEEEMRLIAEQNDFEVIDISGAGTQHFWLTFLKKGI